ncbi:heat shock protein DnaJ domain protein [Halothece sp. PCC 7418]|uniref:IMS domain-containing protein n=1 Tax=Halothece sp. (strain PCC 7418) TaxID=65093 RepID=UPI0002A074C0|nr:IMS domain-containing protein [Halothece sp. PCC 7418]AFZ44812.1 heat shock protein DnaJ domain protein [Halothece sp. PCC 7418]
MRIPLDYYRIIGLPLQATADQIEQAYQDRLRQTSRSEYTQGTLTARKQLIDWAYEVLSDPEQRSEYDANYLLTTYDVEGEETVALPQIESEEEAVVTAPQTPKINVETPQQLLGALLILYELGEYQRVRSLGEWILSNPDHALMAEKEELSPAMQGDLVLTIALSCWELGRELWRQEEYEAAAVAVQEGKNILVDWDLFPQLRQEMTSELNKLSPYRVFELLSQRNVNPEAVPNGIALLKEMFTKRGGIDGECSDDSGLNRDEFLHFVQQIREYLTAQEQEELFAQEAQRSSVAMYLAACAGMARGFAYLEPHYIRQGKQFLQCLEQDHEPDEPTKENQADVYLEESICALLLGDTETALSLIEKSQETDAIAQIQAYSAQGDDTPDLLLGLCNYAEEWLESVLFPKFLDLADESASLKDYFASSSVQETLESFQTAEPETTSHRTSDFLTSPDTVAFPSQIPDAEEITPPQPETSTGKNRRHLRPKRRSRLSSKPSRIAALLLVTGVGLGAIALVIFGVYQGVNALWSRFSQTQPTANIEKNPLALKLETPPVPIPESDSDENTTDSTFLNRDRAAQIINRWFTRKRQALGSDHNVEALRAILTNPLLSQVQSRAQTFSNGNSYQEFEHEIISIDSWQHPTNNPNQGQITATVREAATLYRNGEEIPNRSYDSTLKVRYDVVRENKGWRIQAITVISDQ